MLTNSVMKIEAPDGAVSEVRGRPENAISAPLARPCRPIGRSGWLAHVDAPYRAARHHDHRHAAEIPQAVENVWQFMRDNWLSNRVFNSYDDLVDHCAELDGLGDLHEVQARWLATPLELVPRWTPQIITVTLRPVD